MMRTREYIVESNLGHIVDRVDQANGAYTEEYRSAGFMGLIRVKGERRDGVLTVACSHALNGWRIKLSFMDESEVMVAHSMRIWEVRDRLDWLVANKCITVLGDRYRLV